MTLFCVAMRRDSVSLVRFLFLSHVQVFSCEILLICRLKYSYTCFTSHFCFLVIVVLLILVLFVFAVISLSLIFFMYSLSRFIEVSSMLMNPLPTFFLAHIVCPYHLWDKRAYAPSRSFCFSGLFVKVLPSSTLRMVPSILRGKQPRCLYLWWDFWYIVWFWVLFLFFWCIRFKFFLSSPLIWWCPLPVFPKYL